MPNLADPWSMVYQCLDLRLYVEACDQQAAAHPPHSPVDSPPRSQQTVLQQKPPLELCEYTQLADYIHANSSAGDKSYVTGKRAGARTVRLLAIPDQRPLKTP